MHDHEIVKKASNEKISAALELLNDAAKEKGNEMKELMTDRYAHIKQALLHGAEQGKEVLEKVQVLAQEAIVESKKRVKETATNIDRNVHENPWPYIGGAAVISVLVGYLLGSKRK